MGLSALAVAVAAIAVLSLLWAGVWLGVAHEVSASLLVRHARLIALVLVVVAVLQLVLAFGLWALRSWAWPAGIGLLVVSIMLTLLGKNRGGSGAELASLGLEVVALWYLLSPRVRVALHAGD